MKFLWRKEMVLTCKFASNVDQSNPHDLGILWLVEQSNITASHQVRKGRLTILGEIQTLWTLNWHNLRTRQDFFMKLKNRKAY